MPSAARLRKSVNSASASSSSLTSWPTTAGISSALKRTFAPKASAEILEKLLNSAIANAENNHFMNRANLYVAEIYANQGPTLKRIRPAAKGSAVRIRKRTSHITIVLRESK